MSTSLALVWGAARRCTRSRQRRSVAIAVGERTTEQPVVSSPCERRAGAGLQCVPTRAVRGRIGLQRCCCASRRADTSATDDVHFRSELAYSVRVSIRFDSREGNRLLRPARIGEEDPAPVDTATLCFQRALAPTRCPSRVSAETSRARQESPDWKPDSCGQWRRDTAPSANPRRQKVEPGKCPPSRRWDDTAGLAPTRW